MQNQNQKSLHQKSIQPSKHKNRPQNGKKYLRIIYLSRDLYPKYIKKSYSQQIFQFFKWGKDLNRYLSKEDLQIVNKYMKRLIKHY